MKKGVQSKMRILASISQFALPSHPLSCATSLSLEYTCIIFLTSPSWVSAPESANTRIHSEVFLCAAINMAVCPCSQSEVFIPMKHKMF